MGRQANQAALLGIVRGVRRRWRLRQTLRGLALVGIGVLVALVVSGTGLERLRFTPDAVLIFRILTYVVVLALASWYLIRPLLRRVSDEQVALYLEEHEPKLSQVVVTAIDASESNAHDPSLLRRLVEDAVERCRVVEDGRRIERDALFRWSGALVVTTIVGLVSFLFGPAYLKHGASAVLLPSVSAAEANPYAVQVQPGDATIARGSDLEVSALLDGFTAEDVTLYRRAEGDGNYEPVPMIGTDDGAFEALLFSLDEPTDYFVESSGIRSPTYRVSVEDLPYVDQLQLEYRFPAYTGLGPQVVDDGGDIAVLRGTTVVLRATPTMQTPAGSIVMADSTRIELEVAPEGPLTGSFRVSRDGFYKVELQAQSGVFVDGSPEYSIDVLEDQPPSVTLMKPGRDSNASPIEEVYIEARADDDYGVRSLELVYSVNGGPEDTAVVFNQGGRPLKEVSAGHTFFLEELELVPGDVISYYAKVADNDRVGSSKVTTSDMYFLQIRPFRKDFTQAEQQGGPPQGGGGGGGMDSSLPEQQREIISGTFNLVRDRDDYTAEEFDENVVTLKLAQARLRDQVDNLVAQMVSRGVVGSDPAFETIAEELPKAMEQMELAVDSLEAEKPRQAIPAEQKALQHLLRADEAYREVQVGMQQQGGGGGGGNRSSAEDLADLFELELDKLKNQYETVQREQRQETAEEVDEALERLKELARRQEQAAERQRQRALNSPSGGGGGGGQDQRELAEEVEEAARELERLARETSSDQLERAARELQDAAESMRQSAAGRGNASASQAREALEQLRQARRLLERDSSNALGRSAEDALERVRRLAEQQEDVREEVMDLPTASERRDAIQRLSDRKEVMEGELQDLERELDRLAQEANRDREQRGAGRDLANAADQIRESKLKEKVRYTRAVIENRPDQSTRSLEEEIQTDLEELSERLARAAASITDSNADEMSDALDRTRDLVRGMESLDQRLQERTEEANSRRLGERSEEQGQEGQEGQSGEGQEGQQGQGQEGQSGEGQEGQQGQGQEGQQGEGEEGQQGQGQQGQGQAGGQQGQGEGSQEGSMRQGGPGGGGFGARGGEALSDEEIRQLRREFRERRADAESLRDQLRELGEDVGDLDELIGTLRRMDDQRVYQDLDEVQRLQSLLIEGAKRFEFGLRRRVEGAGDDLLLRGSNEVPPGFEELIEEYYRSLSKSRRGGGGS